MISFPNAKINIGLHVVERRADGYHNLESLFYPIPLTDVLEVLPSDSFRFESSGIAIDAAPESNLVVKAWSILRDKFQLPPVKIHLHKAIPFGAGLGGGSSNAASILNMLNQMFSLGQTPEQLEVMAGTLGADCPFFIKNKPALATGTGNMLDPTDIDLSGYRVVVVKPPFSVSTAEAYRAISPSRPSVPLGTLLSQPVETWRNTIINDFEAPVFKMFPEIARLKETLYRSGAVYASMSGSGSAIFGLFPSLPSGLKTLFPENYFVF